MNQKIDSEIRTSIKEAQAKGLKLLQGPWLSLGKENVLIGVDPIAAVLLKHNMLPDASKITIELLSNPGWIKDACTILSVDRGWLYRFWMGFDRGYQIIFLNEENEETRDDVSFYGICLSKELFKEAK